MIFFQTHPLWICTSSRCSLTYRSSWWWNESFFEYDFSFMICCSSKKYVPALSKTDPSFPPQEISYSTNLSSPFFLDAFKVPAISHTPQDQIMWIMHSTVIRICFQNQRWIDSDRQYKSEMAVTSVQPERLTCSIWSLQSGGLLPLFCVRWSETALGWGFRGFVRLLKMFLFTFPAVAF